MQTSPSLTLFTLTLDVIKAAVGTAFTARRLRPAAARQRRPAAPVRTPAWRRGRSAPPAAPARVPPQAASWDRCTQREQHVISTQKIREQNRRKHILDKVASKPQERLLKVVVALGGDVVVLQVLLAVEGDLLGAHLAVLDIDLVADQHDRDVLAHANDIAMPLLHVLVGLSRRHVEHDDSALTHDVVAIAQSTEAFLTGSIPHVENNRTAVGVEDQWSNLNTDGG